MRYRRRLMQNCRHPIDLISVSYSALPALDSYGSFYEKHAPCTLDVLKIAFYSSGGTHSLKSASYTVAYADSRAFAEDLLQRPCRTRCTVFVGAPRQRGCAKRLSDLEYPIFEAIFHFGSLMLERKIPCFELRHSVFDALVLIIKTANVEALSQALKRRFNATPAFFANDSVVIDVRRLEAGAQLSMDALTALL